MSVPDLTALCALFLDPALDRDKRFYVMRVMYGGRIDDDDFHHVGLTEEFLHSYLADAGFTDIQRVDDFGLFDDSSRLVFHGRKVSLNVSARKAFDNPGAAASPLH